MTNLTVKQNAFVIEYLLDYNATKAAIRAGYSKRSAEVTGHRLLRNAKIYAVINKKMDKLAIDLQEKFIMDAIVARDVMLEVLNDPDALDRDRIRVAQDFLNRVGFVPISKGEMKIRNTIEIRFVEH